MPAIDHTNKNICTIYAFENYIKEEYQRVKKLTREKHSIWLLDNHPEGKIWEHNAVSVIKGTGGTKGETLMAAGIMTVGELKQEKDTDLLDLKAQCPGISIDTLK